MKEENFTESTLKDLRLESLIPKFAAERIEPENVCQLSDDSLYVLVYNYDRGSSLYSVPFVLPKKNISMWLQLLLASNSRSTFQNLESTV